jgi:ceramide glucosyltransferase
MIVAGWILALAALAGTGYQLWSAWLVRRFQRQMLPVPGVFPSVTILKPLAGDEPNLAENLRSFCRQLYPTFQVIFGVHDDQDPALSVARAVAEEFPEADIQVVIGTGRPKGGNPKVANLLTIIPHAKHEVIVLADSDMQVPPDYLLTVVAALQQPEVGIVTCLYVSHPAKGLWSAVGAMGINHGFLPSVLVGQALGRVDGCFGATIALTREMLDQIDGLEPLRDQLADDYLLGAKVRAKGLKIGLAPLLPSTLAHEPDLKTLFAHEVRWGRTLASIDRMGYAGLLVTQAVPLGLLAVLVDGGHLGVTAFVVALLGRLLAVRVQERTLGLPHLPAWMVTIRDFLTLAVQVVALSGRTVRWRGGVYRVDRNGVLVTVEKGVVKP